MVNMKRVIEIDEKDLGILKKTAMSVDDMFNTLQGRIYCAVAGSKDLQDIDVKEKDPRYWFNYYEENGFGEHRVVGFRCSICNKIIPIGGLEYCPHCGVPMKI